MSIHTCRSETTKGRRIAAYGYTADAAIFVRDLGFHDLGSPVDVYAIPIPPHSIAEFHHDGD